MPPTPPSRSRGLLRVLVFVVVLLVAAGTAVWWRSKAARQQVVDQILADVAAATADVPADASALSQLMTRIQQIESHDTDRGLCLALAQIEWSRGRLDRALVAIRSWADGVELMCSEEGSARMVPGSGDANVLVACEPEQLIAELTSGDDAFSDAAVMTLQADTCVGGHVVERGFYRAFPITRLGTF